MSKRSQRKYIKDTRNTHLKWVDAYVDGLVEQGHTVEDAWNSVSRLAWAASLGHDEMQRFAVAVIDHKLKPRK